MAVEERAKGDPQGRAKQNDETGAYSGNLSS